MTTLSKGNSAYKSKFLSESEKLKESLATELIEQFRCSFQNEDRADIKLNVEELCVCFNKCVIFLLALGLSSLYAADTTLPVAESIPISENQLDDSTKEKLSAIYKHQFQQSDNKHKIIADFKALLDGGLHSDITVELQDGKLYHCHRCILAARCQFFDMMFHGDWKESSSNTIKLSSLSQESFEVILNFIYTAKHDLPVDINLAELVLAQDMYDLKSFQDVLKLHFKAHFFHFFHQPCDSCIESLTNAYGVLDSSNVLGYDDIIEACNKWFVRYFPKILGHKSFMKVPKNIRETILLKVKESVNTVNIIGYLKDCSKLKSHFPNVKWAKQAVECVEDVEAYCLEFVCNHFDKVIEQPGFTVCLFEDKNVHMSKLIFEMFVAAAKRFLNKGNCLVIFQRITMLNKRMGMLDLSEKDLSHSIDFVKEITDVTKVFIRKQFLQIRRTREWKDLPEDLKSELGKKAGFIEC